MIHADRLEFAYGAEPVLRDVNIKIADGELVGVIGPSGAGKTTLLKLILGELAPTEGSIGRDDGVALRVGYVPQLEAGERSFPLTVEEMTLLGRAATSRRLPWFSRHEKASALDVLDRLGVSGLARRRLDELSGGQFQRVLIARALMSDPDLLLLDEPTSGIDVSARQQVLELVDELHQDGFTIILTTHDLNWVAPRLPRIVCLNHTVVADGSPLEVLTPEVVRRTYSAEMDVIVHEGRPVLIDSVRGRL